MPRLCWPISSPPGPEDLRDPDAAFEWYRKSAEQDCPQGRLGYAIALMLRADSADKTSAARDELVRAAEAGLPTAHYLLGVGAERAVGTALDEAEARRHYKIAAEAGLGNAQMRLGLMLLEGRGGPADPLNGESWLRRAALAATARRPRCSATSMPVAAPCRRTMSRRRIGSAQRPSAGTRRAARALGMLYLTGAGVARDPDEAAAWFKRAAEAGDLAPKRISRRCCRRGRRPHSRMSRRPCMNGSSARPSKAT